MNQDYKQLLTQVIKKQIIILGPDITLLKARNVQGLVVADDGTVTDISGDSQQITQKLIDQFVQLSGEIVRKTMEPLLTLNQTPVTSATPTPTVVPQPIPTPVTTSPTIPAQPIVPPTQPVQNTQPAPQPVVPNNPVNSSQDTLAQQPKTVQ